MHTTQNSLVQVLMAFGYHHTGLAKVSNLEGLRQHCEVCSTPLSNEQHPGRNICHFFHVYIQWLPVQVSVWKRHLNTSISDLIATKPLYM